MSTLPSVPTKRPLRRGAVPLQVHGSLPPLFFVPGLGGDPINMRQVALLLGANQPVYGLQYRGGDGQALPQRPIEQMAREFLADIRRVAPHGPYCLGGFSAGGVVAFELAQMLTGLGEKVRTLVLLDAFHPASPRPSRRTRLDRAIERCRRDGPRHELQRFTAQLPLRWEVVQAKLYPMLGAQRRDGGNLQDQAAFLVALSRYSPSPYAGEVLLIRTGHQSAMDLGYEPHESNGWRRSVLGNLRVTTLECKHEELLKDHAEDVARIVGRALEL